MQTHKSLLIIRVKPHIRNEPLTVVIRLRVRTNINSQYRVYVNDEHEQRTISSNTQQNSEIGV